MIPRRAVIAAALLPLLPETVMAETTERYGLFGKMIAAPGQRDTLAAILLEGTTAMPGCLLYVVARDPTDPNALWINEIWVDKQHHADSLKLPSVQAAIAKGRPLIAGFGPERFETTPIGGAGL